jgi:signal transduction histidine kinase
VAADTGRLVRLFQSVIENAVQHSPEAGVVEIAAAEAVQDGTRLVQCLVQDSGPGFSDEALVKGFEPFFTDRAGGTGLGLAIAWKIALEHGATIGLSNAPEGGAVVSLGLPVVASS